MTNQEPLPPSVSEKMEGRWLALILLSGIVLTTLLPLGMMLPLSSGAWQVTFAVQLILSIAGSAYCLIIVWSSFEESQELRLLAVLILVLVAIFLGLESLHPITTRDALIHHLAVPRWWLAQNSIYAIPWHEWSFYPMLLNLAYTGLLSWGLERACSLYHAQYLLVLATSSLLMLRRLGCEKPLQLFGFLLCICLPLNLHLAATPLVDLGLAAYCSCALFCLIRLGLTATKPVSYALAIGCFLGLAMACKYNGFLFAALFFAWGLVVCLRVQTIPLATRARVYCLAGLCAVVVISPWLLKNYSWTGNPVYPLAKGLFGMTNAGAGPSVTALDREMGLYGRSLIDVLLIPLTMLFRGQDDNPRYFDGVLSPVLVLLFCGVLSTKARSWALLLAALSASYFLVAFTSSGSRIRYLVPLVAPIVLLSTLGLEEITARLRKPAILLGVGILAVLWSLQYSWGHLSKTGSLSYAAERFSSATELPELDATYLRKSIPEYKAIEFVNREVGNKQRIYLLFTSNLFYYFAPEVFSGGYLSEGPLLRWLKASANPEELAQEFLQHNLSFLLVNIPRLQQSLPLSLQAREIQLWNEFEKHHLRLVAHDGVTALWALQSPNLESSQEAKQP